MKIIRQKMCSKTNCYCEMNVYVHDDLTVDPEICEEDSNRSVPKTVSLEKEKERLMNQ